MSRIPREVFRLLAYDHFVWAWSQDADKAVRRPRMQVPAKVAPVPNNISWNGQTVTGKSHIGAAIRAMLAELPKGSFIYSTVPPPTSVTPVYPPNRSSDSE